MIFVTVGTQLQFNRLISSVSTWAGKTQSEVFAQVGPTEIEFSHIAQKSFLEPREFDHYFLSSDLIVAHAGMGSILTALSYGKPIIILPRKASLNEHRNDHQMATAERFSNRKGVWVAWDEDQLHLLLDEWLTQGFSENSKISPFAPDTFLMKLRLLIDD